MTEELQSESGTAAVATQERPPRNLSSAEAAKSAGEVAKVLARGKTGKGGEVLTKADLAGLLALMEERMTLTLKVTDEKLRGIVREVIREELSVLLGGTNAKAQATDSPKAGAEPKGNDGAAKGEPTRRKQG